MTKKNYLQILFLFCSLTFLGQDFHFSQFNAVPFWLNPALIGGNDDIDIGAIYRTQDKGINNPYNTYGAFANVSLFKKRESNSYFGLGVGFIQDNNKNIQCTSSLAALTLSYHLKINKNNLISVGVQPFFFQKSTNFNSLKWGDQYDGTTYNSNLPSGESANFSKVTKIDGAFGLNYQFAKGTHNSITDSENKLQVGLSMFHFPGVGNSFYGSQEKIYSRYVFNAAYTFKPENSKFGLSPVLFFQKQGPSNEIIFGCNTFFILQESSSRTSYIKSSSVTAGLMYRVKDAIIVTAGLNFSNYSFNLGYDINLSSLTTSTKSFGAVELVLRYRMKRTH
ncbi:MAG TPA: PorP/SprF family type IX secretion system membrane protein [Bacteroidia bacterium]|jgi:type IX secretion system PorP/SprF family membrane protein|nr:PorP/SprF family type IX secretion system membrane protein [Bacteroidia bacterium]